MTTKTATRRSRSADCSRYQLSNGNTLCVWEDCVVLYDKEGYHTKTAASKFNTQVWCEVAEEFEEYSSCIAKVSNEAVGKAVAVIWLKAAGYKII